MKRIKFLITILIVFTSIAVFAGESSSEKKLEIYLIRHAKVIQDKPFLVSASKADEIHEAYNILPVEVFNPDSILNLLPGGQSVVYTSNLPRAIQTAEQLYPRADSLIVSSLFAEYELQMISAPVVKLPYFVWTSLSRVLSFTINNFRSKSKQERQRMLKAVDRLIELAENQEQVVIVSHGYFIKDIRKQLKKKGWKLTVSNGHKNLSVTKATKVED